MDKRKDPHPPRDSADAGPHDSGHDPSAQPERSKPGKSRREFLKQATVTGAGLVAAP
jgi:hypothetical protein